jgi:NAD(P)-dependent dehydrogenase (short-subunit alcohol dehydrogenase family)|tara:strand:+ start:1570 stop:2373 length:804 start_codon:yes stop_codon:yes gene_type:complete
MKYVIIGASQGIGKEIANSLSKKNKLILCSRNIRSVKKNFSNNDHLFLKFDANNIRDVNKLFKLAKSKFGTIDGIICCQGFLGEPENICDYDIKKWFKIFDLNFKSNLIIIRKLLKLVKKNQFSKIIFFSGGGAFNTWEKFSAYSVAKTALVRFSENLALELKKYKIIVNCIAPGFMKTNIHNKSLKKIKKLPKEYRSQLQNNMKNKPDFRKVVELINFIIKTKSSDISGRTISANWDKWNDRNFLNFLKKNKDYLTLRRVKTNKNF